MNAQHAMDAADDAAKRKAKPRHAPKPPTSTKAERRAFGKFVRTHREAAGMTVADFAVRLGLQPGSRPFVYAIEAGKASIPSAVSLTRWAHALGVTTAALFCAAGKVPPGVTAWATADERTMELLELAATVKPDEYAMKRIRACVMGL